MDLSRIIELLLVISGYLRRRNDCLVLLKPAYDAKFWDELLPAGIGLRKCGSPVTTPFTHLGKSI
jgi:hypothetical protein